MTNTSEIRPIGDIALDICNDWKNVHYAAKPYLQAMLFLNNATDKYGFDNASSIVNYFLSNASTYRGGRAKELKAELKRAIK